MSFKVNDDYTISVHYDNLDPIGVEDLIKRLEGNLRLIRLNPTDPIVVFRRSIRRSKTGAVSFRFEWDETDIVLHPEDVDLENPPEPTVELTQDQYNQYVETFRKLFAED